MARRRKGVVWLALSGSPEITGNAITFRPTKIEKGPSAGQFQAAVVRSDQYFQSGEISFEVNRGSGESACQVILNQYAQREIWLRFTGSENQYVIAGYQGGVTTQSRSLVGE